jgi:hypothetical protein
MDLVYNIDTILTHLRGDSDLIRKIANILDGIIRSGVQLMDIEGPRFIE